MSPTSNHGLKHMCKLVGASVLTFLLFCFLCLGGDGQLGARLAPPYPSGRTGPPRAKTPCGHLEVTNPLVHVSDSRTYLVSSYMEHRSEHSQIRTIAIVKREEKPSYSCMFCCDEELQNSSARYEIHSDHFGFDYGTADILCSVPENCLMPSHIAIYTGPLRGQKPVLPIRNQQERQESFPYQFTVCISVMYDYTNVMQLVQTLEMFRLLGAQHVAIYKSSCNAATQRVLDYYVQAGFVEIIPWPITKYINVSRGWRHSVSPGDLHYFGQIAALNDCVYRFMYQTQYVVLPDLDEIIVPLTVDTWTELLPLLEQQYGRHLSFEFENHVFRNTVSGRNAKCPNAFNNYKVIVNPRMVYRTTVHGLLRADCKGVRVDRDVARIYHIRAPWRQDVTDDKLIQDERLWDYAPRLVPAVSDVLKKTSPR